MSGFQSNEIVDITIKGVRVRHQAADGIVTIFDEDERCFSMPPQAAITRVAPAEWPPQPGDLWRAKGGELYFAADVHDSAETDDPEIVLVATFEDYRQSPDRVSQLYGPLTLVHREPKPEPPLCPSCRDGKHVHICVGDPCECRCQSEATD